MSDEQVTAGLQPVSKARNDFGLRTFIEIDHHIPAKDDWVQSGHWQSFYEIDSLKRYGASEL
jgi:hypothetical protein